METTKPEGAQPGNNNAGKGTDWRDSIRHALAKVGRKEKGNEAAYRKGLNKVAEKFIEAAEDGEAWAMKELGDRMDGKPAQSIDLTGEVNIPLSGTVNLVKSSD